MKTRSSPTKRVRRLRFLLDGEDNSFVVVIGENKTVDTLKELIHKKCKKVMDGTFAEELALFKADIDLSARSKDSLREIKINKNDEGVQELMERKTVSHFWPTQPVETERLHVIAKLPAAVGADSLKRKAAEAMDEPDDFKKAKNSKLATTAPSDSSRPKDYEATQKNPSQRFLDDRPSADNVPPAPLLYHGFGHFHDVYNGEHDVPFLSDIDFLALEVAVDDFADKMGEFFEDEDDRRHQGLHLLNEIFSCRKESAPPFYRLHAQSIYRFITDGHNLAAHLSAGMVVESRL